MTSRYIDEFVRGARSSEMLALKLWPNAKEITESFGAYAAVREHLASFKLGDPTVTMIAVGDGRTPRTAATFAMRSAWRCVSVDPSLVKAARSTRWSSVGRLELIPRRAEDVTITCTGPVVIVAVHSHAPLDVAVKMVRTTGPIAVVAIPCCVPQRLQLEPDLMYDDMGIDSPMRRVLVWHSVL